METCRGDHNTTNARLSELGATPAAQVSGGKIPPSSTKEKGRCKSTVTSAQHFPPSGSPQTAKQHATPGTGGPSEVDSSELSSQAPRLQRNFPPACPKDCFARLETVLFLFFYILKLGFSPLCLILCGLLARFG